MEYNDDAPLKALKKEVHKAAMFNVYSMVHTGFVVEHTVMTLRPVQRYCD